MQVVLKNNPLSVLAPGPVQLKSGRSDTTDVGYWDRLKRRESKTITRAFCAGFGCQANYPSDLDQNARSRPYCTKRGKTTAGVYFASLSRQSNAKSG